MTRAPTRPEPAAATPTAPPIQIDSHASLSRAVDEAARLLQADGAMVYLVDGDRMRFAVDAGIQNAEAQQLIRDLSLPVGVGLFGHAVASGEVVVSADYRRDKRFPHSPIADRIVSVANMRSMVAAPLIADGEVLGALGAYSSRIDGFDESGIALLRALADHAATTIANQRLIDRLARSQEELARLTDDLRGHADELAHRVEAQRTLAEMATQLTSLRDPSEVLVQTLQEAARLLKGDGGQIGMVTTDPDGKLRWADGHSLVHGELTAFTKDDHTTVDDGVSGRALLERKVTWTDDYTVDPSFPHDARSDRIARRLGIRAVIAAPLIADGEPIGAIGVYSERPGAFDADDGELLGLLADQAAIVLTNARLNREAEVSADQLARRVEAQRTLGEIAAAITSLRDPSAVLMRTIKEATRLLDADNVVIHQVRPGSRELADYRDVFNAGPDTPPVAEVTVSIGQGIAGRAISDGVVSWTGDYLADTSFTHTDRADEWIRRFGYHSQMSAPLIGEEGGALGAISAYSSRVDAFGPDDAALLGALASQAAIVLGNARLYEELERRIEAQRSLGEIATRITALREPGDVLQRTLDEAVRLLDGDGGRIELVHERGELHWAFGHSAIDLPIEREAGEKPVVADEGVSGRAVAERRVVLTGDYLADESFVHAEAPDRYIRQHGIRSVISAPLIGEEGAIGSLTVHSQTREAFDLADAELLEVLASQAAIAVTNARLYEQLRERVDAQRALASITAEIAELHDPAAVLQRTAEEALRLLRADTALINPLENDESLLGWPIAYAPTDGPADDLPVRVGAGISGGAMAERRVMRTGDYLSDPAFDHTDDLDAYIRRRGMVSVMTAPLVSSAGGLGALTVQSGRRNAFDENDEELLRLLADQAAIAITNARLYDELGKESAALARQTDSQRRLLQINQRLLSTLESASVLELIADGLKSVVWYDNLAVYRVEDADDSVLRPVLARDHNATAVLDFVIPRGQGLTWWTVEHREPVLLNSALGDERIVQIPNTPVEDEAIIVVPLISGDEVIGAMNISRTGGPEVAFTDADFELVQLFAAQAAVAITNSRLYEQLRERADAQRSLAEIAAQIASLHEPQTVLDRAVADAARLLGADRAQINLLSDDGKHLDPPITAAPVPPSEDDVIVPIGSGIAGMAAAEKRVRWTGDYLGDLAFPHDEGDAWIERQQIHSMMAAPLVGPDRLIGTITIQSTAPNAFGSDDAELLKLLADQAAITLTNARLYAELEESERRYRHLVDYSPDIVWSVDGEGRFTFFSESLEARTGIKPEDLLGRPFSALGGEETFPGVTAAWEALRNDPASEQRIRLALPLPDGRISQSEIAATGTIVDGKFAGAHGSLRDISERERLEGDLRNQAAELAASQERAHLARELHDSVTQALFSMGLTLRTLEILLGTDTDAARTKLVELRELQKDALAEMRTLIFELRPSSLESDGLVQALRTHATAVQRRTGLAIVVDAEPIDRLPLSAEEALYRIGQEALHNVVKHANASNAAIRITRERDSVLLTVTDDGGGFEPDAVPRGHLGLIGMRQRVDLVGGELRVESRPGRGTKIEASVPVGEPSAE